MTLRFRFDPVKAIAAIAWLANKKPGISRHTTMKTLFYADKWHLNQYGRPIVGDTYVRMEYGPVASETYNIIKGESFALEQFAAVPFVVDGKHIRPEGELDITSLSESDVEALTWAFEEYAHRSFAELTKISHAEVAWQNAGWHMNYEDFVEGENRDELIEDLRESASSLVL